MRVQKLGGVMSVRAVWAYLMLIIMAPNLQAVADENSAITDEQSANVVLVEKVSRYSDLDNNIYHFKVTLDNQQTFEVPASMDDLLGEKINVGMPFQLKGEEFLPEMPGFSTFTYSSLDGTIQLIGSFPSIQSHWTPSESQESVVVTRKWSQRSGMSNITFWVGFSDDSSRGVTYADYSSDLYKEGNKYYKIPPPEGEKADILVEVATGRIIHGADHSRFTKVTW